MARLRTGSFLAGFGVTRCLMARLLTGSFLAGFGVTRP
jgi:hypothetical protein